MTDLCNGSEGGVLVRLVTRCIGATVQSLDVHSVSTETTPLSSRTVRSIDIRYAVESALIDVGLCCDEGAAKEEKA